MTKPEGSETERQQAEKTSSTCEGCVIAAADAGRLTRQTTQGVMRVSVHSWSCCWWRLAEAANMSVFDPQLLTSSTHNNAAAPINVHAALCSASRETSLTYCYQRRSAV